MSRTPGQKRAPSRFDSDDDEFERRRPSSAGRSGNDWFRNVQTEMRRSGQLLDEPMFSPVRSTSVAQSVPTPKTQASAPPAATAAPASAAKPSNLFTGVMAFVATPFDAAGRVDTTAIAAYAASLKLDGVTAVVVGGFLGEYLSLSERKQAVQAWTGQSALVKVCLAIDDSIVADAADLVAAAQGIAAVVVLPGAGSSAVGVADVLLSLQRVAGSTPLLVAVDDATPSASSVVDAVGPGRCPSFRGVLAKSVRDLTVTAPSQPFERISTSEEGFASAAIAGATAFASPLATFAAPLFGKLTSAASKGDVGQIKALTGLLSQLLVLCRGTNTGDGFSDAAARFRWYAHAKAAASLRLDRDIGGLRPPASRLSLMDVTQLRQGLELFVKAYAAAAPATAAPAKINIFAMPGFNGLLNPKIEASIRKCASAIGMPNLRRKFPHLDNPNWRKRLPDPATLDAAQFIDHTILKPEATAAEISTLCAEAKKHRFYAVCVNGSRVDQCLSELRGSSVLVAAVIGFPLGAGTPKAHAREAREIVEKGAGEIDMVMNVGKFKDGDLLAVFEDIKAVVDASAPGIVKVIFETCLLNLEECIDACVLSVAAGAHFVKTSTGFNKGGATPDMIDAMLATVGNEAQVKASGGVRDGPAAIAYISAGVMRIGTSSGVAIVSGKASGGGY